MTDKKSNPENRINPIWGTFVSYHPALPAELQHLSEGAWLQKSNRGDWPPFMRIMGQKSVAVWRKSDISAAFAAHWSITHPHCVDKLITECGYPEPEGYAAAKKARIVEEKREREREYMKNYRAKKIGKTTNAE